MSSSQDSNVIEVQYSDDTIIQCREYFSQYRKRLLWVAQDVFVDSSGRHWPGEIRIERETPDEAISAMRNRLDRVREDVERQRNILRRLRARGLTVGVVDLPVSTALMDYLQPDLVRGLDSTVCPTCGLDPNRCVCDLNGEAMEGGKP